MPVFEVSPVLTVQYLDVADWSTLPSIASSASARSSSEGESQTLSTIAKRVFLYFPLKSEPGLVNGMEDVISELLKGPSS